MTLQWYLHLQTRPLQISPLHPKVFDFFYFDFSCGLSQAVFLN